jgi:DNA-binding winged helix-turn-helix (wHTH) protein
MSAFCPHCGCDIEPDAPVRLGESSYDPATMEFSYRGTVIPLPRACRTIIATLLKARGHTVRHDALLNRLGSDAEDGDNLLRNRIAFARRTLRPFGADECIGTVPCEGYRWVS